MSFEVRLSALLLLGLMTSCQPTLPAAGLTVRAALCAPTHEVVDLCVCVGATLQDYDADALTATLAPHGVLLLKLDAASASSEQMQR